MVMGVVRNRIQVFGKVQGVFFRASAKMQAEELGLVGWVRNEPEGSVLIEAEGPEDKVLEMIDWCKEGPTFSRVDRLDIEAIEREGNVDFEIKY